MTISRKCDPNNPLFLGENIEAWIEKRISLIKSGSIDGVEKDAPTIVLHISDAEYSPQHNRLDYRNFGTDQSRLPMLESSGHQQIQWNVDGPFKIDRYRGRTQLFRSGIIESIDISLLNPHSSEKILTCGSIESAIVDTLPTYINLLTYLGADFPIQATLTILGVKEFRHAGTQQMMAMRSKGSAIERDHLESLPRVHLIDSEDVSQRLRPMFDALWNSLGIPCSPNYDEHDQWRNSN